MIPYLGVGAEDPGLNCGLPWLSIFLLHVGDYAQELSEDYTISDALSRVRNAVVAAEAAAMEFRGKFLDYNFLWISDLNAALQVRNLRLVPLTHGCTETPPQRARCMISCRLDTVGY